MTDALCQGSVKADWRGSWVWTAPVEKARNAYAFFRRTFQADTAGVLHLEITADSFYWLYVDGEYVGRGPARAHLDYYSFDRHERPLAAGPHAIAVLAHHIGVVNATVMTGRPGLLVGARFANGSTRADLSSGPDWRCAPADAWRGDLPCLMSHFGFWEERDLRRLPAGWTGTGFDDAGWAPAAVIGRPPCAPWTRLIARDIPLPQEAPIAFRAITAGGTWREGAVQEDDARKRNQVAGGWLEAASTTGIPSKEAAVRERAARPVPAGLPHDVELAAGAGAWLTLDFGRTVSGYPVVEVECADDGVQLDLSYDDLVGPAGAVDPERSYARMTDRFVLARGRNLVRPVHPRGFRYVTLDLAGAGRATVRAAQAVEETYPFLPPAAFACSDPALGEFARKAALTVRICTTDAFTDCATRERVQWMEDLYMHARVAAYAFGDTALLRRALFQGAQNALPDGRINGFMPSERTGCAFASSSLVWLHLLADYRLFAADEAGVGALLPTARRLLDFLASRADAEGLIASWPAGQFWDWAPIEASGCLLLTNAAYAWALRRLGEMADGGAPRSAGNGRAQRPAPTGPGGASDWIAEELGRDLAARADTVCAAAHARFWDAERCLYRDACPADRPPIYSQQANALAALAGVCPAAERVALLRRITDPANLWPVPEGEHSLNDANRPGPEKIVPVGTLWFGHFVCQALFEAGLGAEALDQMRLLWGAHAALPTCPETRVPRGNIFLCHGWAAGPAFLLPAYVLGARPTGPGWSSAVVAPCASLPLDQASGEVPTPHGPLRVSWQRRAGAPEVTVHAPPGVRVATG